MDDAVRVSNSRQTETAPPKSDDFFTRPPTLSLPKGGGAIRGIGEKFTANPVTGTGSFSIPIACSPGRAGFGPRLTLSYDSGTGNGPFGFGWHLPSPAITRKTDKGLPQYFDAENSDVFLLSGAEDLVPEYMKDAAGVWIKDRGQFVFNDSAYGGYRIRRYRPRIEGLFARIERWSNQTDPHDVYWRSIAKDNVTTVYGKSAESRLVDPTDGGKIFSWLICESYDDKGNAILYEYKPEDDVLVDLSAANERNRVRTVQRHLKRIKYCNKTPRVGNEDLAKRKDWLFEVVFDYGNTTKKSRDRTTTILQAPFAGNGCAGTIRSRATDRGLRCGAIGCASARSCFTIFRTRTSAATAWLSPRILLIETRVVR